MASRLTHTTYRSAARKVPVLRALGGPDQLLGMAARAGELLRDRGAWRAAADVARSTPGLVTALWGVARDPRVPLRYRIALPGVVAYLVMPLDLIPDLIPVLGALDDITLTIMVLLWVLRGVDERVLREHWRGNDALLRILRPATAA